MDTQAVTHVSGDVLRAFGLGQLDDATAAAVVTHLESCPACCQEAAAVSGDDFLKRFRGAKGAFENTLDDSALATADRAPRFDPSWPQRVGRYQILERLGAGGMGDVYKAHDPQLDRLVALKVPRFGERQDRGRAVQRFLREARAAAAIRHPHVCSIHDAGEDSGTPFVVMDYVAGATLAQRLKAGRFDDVRAAALLARQVADALAAVHAHSIIHRDLKPGNILLSRGADIPVCRGEEGRQECLPHEDAILTDFGLARPENDTERLTAVGAVVGTPAYMAPEQVTGTGKLGPWTDLYSLGVVFYQMLTGTLPFKGDSVSLLYKIGHEQPPAPTSLRADLDPALEAIVLKAMARRPEDRFQSAADFSAALGRWLAPAAEIPPPRAPAPFSKPQDESSGPGGIAKSRRHRLWLAAAAILIAGLSVLTAQVIIRIKGPDGKETEVTAPGGSKVTVDAKGRVNIELPGQKGKADDKANKAEAADQQPLKPFHPMALVQRPARMKGVTTWSIVPRAHPGGSTPLAYSRDGKLLYSAGVDGVIRTWNTQTRALTKAFVGHQGIILGFALSPDGKILATGGDDGTVRLWDPESGKPSTLNDSIHPNRWSFLAWSPNSKLLAGVSNASSIYLWDDFKKPPKIHSAFPANAVAWSPDSARLAIAGTDKKVRICDAQTGKLLVTMDGHQDEVHRVVWSSTGKLASLGRDNTVRLWDPESGKSLQVIKLGREMGCLAWLPDGSALAVPDAFKIDLWNPSSGKITRTIRSNRENMCWNLDWSPDGKTLACSDNASNITFWDVETGKEKGTIFEGPVPTEGVALSPKGDRLMSRSLGLQVFEANSGRHLTYLPVHAPEFGHTTIAWSPDQKRVACASNDSPAVQLWNSYNGSFLRNLEGHTGAILAVAWSLDGKLAASAGKDSLIRLWDMAKYQIDQVLKAHKGDVRALTWSPDSKKLASAGADGSIRIWDTGSGKLEQTLQVPGGGETYSLAWSPGGAILASGGLSVIRLWNLAIGQAEETLAATETNEGPILCLAWSPDGKVLVSGSTYAHLRFWDAVTGRCLRTIEENQYFFTGASWSPDGNSLLWGCLQGPARLWDTRANQLRASFYTFVDNSWLTVSADGHYRGSPKIEEHIVYVAGMEDGRQETFTAAEFAKRFGWKNDPEKVKLLP